MISHLNYDSKEHALYFDLTQHHFRDIYKYKFDDDSISKVYDNHLYDERNMALGKKA